MTQDVMTQDVMTHDAQIADFYITCAACVEKLAHVHVNLCL